MKLQANYRCSFNGRRKKAKPLWQEQLIFYHNSNQSISPLTIQRPWSGTSTGGSRGARHSAHFLRWRSCATWPSYLRWPSHWSPRACAPDPPQTSQVQEATSCDATALRRPSRPSPPPPSSSPPWPRLPSSSSSVRLSQLRPLPASLLHNNYAEAWRAT